MISIRRAAVVGLALGLGLGAFVPAMASDKHDNWSGGWGHGSSHDSGVWGLDEAGRDRGAFGLKVTGHGPAWGVPVDEHDRFDMPIVLDGDVLGADGSGWDMGLSAYGIDDASVTGDNPAADFYLGQVGQGVGLSTDNWDNDRQGWLGGLLGDDNWQVGGLW